MRIVTFERLDHAPTPMGAAASRLDLDCVAPGVPRLGAFVPHGAHAGEVVDLNRALAVELGPEDAIVLPRVSNEVDFEGELAVVIGRRACAVDVADALGHVAGYCVANDVTARDFQNVRGQRFIGKSCDTFAPLGPVLVTADEIADPQEARHHGPCVRGGNAARQHARDDVPDRRGHRLCVATPDLRA